MTIVHFALHLCPHCMGLRGSNSLYFYDQYWRFVGKVSSGLSQLNVEMSNTIETFYNWLLFTFRASAVKKQ